MTGEAAWPPPGMSFGEVPVLGSRMAFVAGGSGDTVLFLHGNPTSSFLWRRVLPGLTGSARCVAVDLIGMGRSGKPGIGYRFADHAVYLEAFADRLGLRDITVVGHDWGAVLGLDLLRRRPDVVGRIAVCEGHLHPFGRWEDMGPGAGELFSRLRTPGVGEHLVLQENFFVEQVLPGGMNQPLTAVEHDAYRGPFPTPRDRLPVLRWIQQIPVGGDPADVDAAVRRNQDALLRGPVPRLLLHGEPGSVVGAAEVAWCRRDGAGLEIVSVGAGTHFLPEDQPEAISRALAAWLGGRGESRLARFVRHRSGRGLPAVHPARRPIRQSSSYIGTLRLSHEPAHAQNAITTPRRRPALSPSWGCPVTRKSALCQLLQPVRRLCQQSRPGFGWTAAAACRFTENQYRLPGRSDWRALAPAAARAIFTVMHDVTSLAVKKARPSQRGVAGPRRLSRDRGERRLTWH